MRNIVIVSGLVVICHIVIVHTNKECGLSDSNALIPWAVNIYQSDGAGGYEFICSGSLVAPRVIITAASCVFDESTNQVKNKKFGIAAGQNYKAWSKDQNQNVQFREIPRGNVLTMKQYKGSANKYSHNLAMIYLNVDAKFNLTPDIKKACVYWDNDFIEEEHITYSIPLKVISWEPGQNATYTVIAPTYLDNDSCRCVVPKSFEEFLTFDKMCGEVSDPHIGDVVGSGLYAFNTIQKKWYVIGIANEVTMANSKTYVTFVQLQLHLNWLSNNAFIYI